MSLANNVRQSQAFIIIKINNDKLLVVFIQNVLLFDYATKVIRHKVAPNAKILI